MSIEAAASHAETIAVESQILSSSYPTYPEHSQEAMPTLGGVASQGDTCAAFRTPVAMSHVHSRLARNESGISSDGSYLTTSHEHEVEESTPRVSHGVTSASPQSRSDDSAVVAFAEQLGQSCDPEKQSHDPECSSEGKPCDSQGRSCDSQGKPCDSQGRSCDSQGKPCDSQGRSCDSQGKPCDSQGRSCDSQGRSCDSQERSCDSQERSCDSQERSCDSQGQRGNTAHIQRIRSRPLWRNSDSIETDV